MKEIETKEMLKWHFFCIFCLFIALFHFFFFPSCNPFHSIHILSFFVNVSTIHYCILFAKKTKEFEWHECKWFILHSLWHLGQVQANKIETTMLFKQEREREGKKLHFMFYGCHVTYNVIRSLHMVSSILYSVFGWLGILEIKKKSTLKKIYRLLSGMMSSFSN